ncbi:zinc-binding dehydrogenase, partial [Escherichia coli]
FACRESHFSAYLTLWFPLLIWWTPLCLICQILTRRFRLYAYVKNVIVADRIDERLEKAKESGADWAINNSQTPLGEIFAEKGIKPTLIIDAACHPSILKEAVTLASPAARIVLMGFSSEPSEVIQQGITGKELSIFSSRLNANKFPVVIDWLSKGLIKPEKLITHTFDFQHVADAISLFEQDQKHCCKVLLTFSE